MGRLASGGGSHRRSAAAWPRAPTGICTCFRQGQRSGPLMGPGALQRDSSTERRTWGGYKGRSTRARVPTVSLSPMLSQNGKCKRVGHARCEDSAFERCKAVMPAACPRGRGSDPRLVGHGNRRPPNVTSLLRTFFKMAGLCTCGVRFPPAATWATSKHLRPHADPRHIRQRTHSQDAAMTTFDRCQTRQTLLTLHIFLTRQTL